jgi:tetratricopeptide (TPR) repeat protein
VNEQNPNEAGLQQPVPLPAEDPSAPGAMEPRLRLVALATLLVMTVAAYYPSLSGGFVWDDLSLVATPGFKTTAGLFSFWALPVKNPLEEHYWPVTYTAFWLQHRVWGFDPFGYRLVNLGLHVLNSLLVWALLRRMAVQGAWLAAALFAVHPVHVESVAWIIELKDVLSGFFYLAAFHAYLHFRSGRRPAPYLLALLCFTLGMWSKSVVVTLPAAILIYEWWQQGTLGRREWLQALPFFLLAAALGIADYAIAAKAGSAEFGFGIPQRILIAGRAFWHYAGKLIFPTGLMAFYPKWDFGVASPLHVVPVLATIAAPLFLIGARHRIGRASFAAFAFYAVTLSPTLGLIQFSFMQHSFVADRFQYLAIVAPLALACGGSVRAWEGWGALPRRAGIAASAGLLLALSASTWHHAALFRSSETLSRHSISRNPEAWAARLMLGVILSNRGDHAGAEEQFRAALKAQPRDPVIRANLAFSLWQQEKPADAVSEANKALALADTNVTALAVRGAAQVQLGERLKGEADLREALRLDPDNRIGVRMLDLATSPTTPR